MRDEGSSGHCTLLRIHRRTCEAEDWRLMNDVSTGFEERGSRRYIGKHIVAYVEFDVHRTQVQPTAILWLGTPSSAIQETFHSRKRAPIANMETRPDLTKRRQMAWSLCSTKRHMGLGAYVVLLAISV